MRRVTSKYVIERDFISKGVFRPQNHQKRLAAGLRPDPLGELECSPRPPSTVGGMEGNILAVVRALCGEKGGGVESTLEEVEMNEKGYF